MSDDTLEKVYRVNLEEKLISFLSERFGLDPSQAMELYYGSRLAEKIGKGTYGVQYLDHKVLAEILWQTEPERFP